MAQSYSKNLGLYAERVGALNVVLADKGAADRVLSQLKRIARWVVGGEAAEAHCQVGGGWWVVSQVSLSEAQWQMGDVPAPALPGTCQGLAAKHSPLFHSHPPTPSLAWLQGDLEQPARARRAHRGGGGGQRGDVWSVAAGDGDDGRAHQGGVCVGGCWLDRDWWAGTGGQGLASPCCLLPLPAMPLFLYHLFLACCKDRMPLLVALVHAPKCLLPPSCVLQTVRQDLYDNLVALNPDKDWSFVLNQIGMFSFTGLNTKQVRLRQGREDRVSHFVEGLVSLLVILGL